MMTQLRSLARAQQERAAQQPSRSTLPVEAVEEVLQGVQQRIVEAVSARQASELAEVKALLAEAKSEQGAGEPRNDARRSPSHGAREAQAEVLARLQHIEARLVERTSPAKESVAAEEVSAELRALQDGLQRMQARTVEQLVAQHAEERSELQRRSDAQMAQLRQELLEARASAEASMAAGGHEDAAASVELTAITKRLAAIEALVQRNVSQERAELGELYRLRIQNTQRVRFKDIVPRLCMLLT